MKRCSTSPGIRVNANQTVNKILFHTIRMPITGNNFEGKRTVGKEYGKTNTSLRRI